MNLQKRSHTSDGWGVTCVKKLLNVNEPADYYAETMRQSYQGITRFLPDGVFTIASEPGGCYFCFDFRADPDRPRVVFWDHDRADETNRDEALVPIADSFTQFLELLYEDEDEELAIDG
jgi:hypothetical protein